MEQQRLNKEIDRQLQRDKRNQRKEVKLLLLGELVHCLFAICPFCLDKCFKSSICLKHGVNKALPSQGRASWLPIDRSAGYER